MCDVQRGRTATAQDGSLGFERAATAMLSRVLLRIIGTSFKVCELDNFAVNQIAIKGWDGNCPGLQTCVQTSYALSTL